MTSLRFPTDFQVCLKRSLLVLVAVALIGGRAASADPLGAGSGKLFRLGEASRFQEGCFEPCLCPLLDHVAARGTMRLVYEGNFAGIETYAVRDVNFGISTPDGLQSITGHGVYRIGSPGALTVIAHRLELDLRVGDDAIAHFDSLWTTKDNMDRIVITVSINQMYCWDRVIGVDAHPVPSGDLIHYELLSQSTFQIGCWDPCDCLLSPELAMTGLFDLARLPSTTFLREFAVLNVDWQVVSPDAASAFRLRGFGLYRIRGELSFEHRMALSLSVNDEPAVTFDSGWVTGGGEFPSVATMLSIHGLECFDIALRVVSGPVDIPICGGIAGLPCGDGQFCKLPAGSCCCDFTGVCTQVPDACPAYWNPVCGCDGLTYGNACAADARGVSIDYYGPCASDCKPRDDGFGCVEVVCSNRPEIQCIGTVFELDVAAGAIRTAVCECRDMNVCHLEFGDSGPLAVGGCPDGRVCEVVAIDTDGDGHPDRLKAECVPGEHACCLPSGACFDLPSNVCEAEGGLSFPDSGCEVVYCPPPTEGACCVATAAGDVGCAITTGNQCAAEGGEYLGDGSHCPLDPSLPCGFAPHGACCLVGSATDVICATLSHEECSAAGGEYLGDGTQCPSDPSHSCGPVCGGFTGIPCDDPAEFCKFPIGTCYWDDLQGRCTPIPSGGCPEYYAPVCGCDGVTYGNVCESDAAGVSILHEGVCESRCVATRVLAETDVAYCPATPMKVLILLGPPDGASAIALDDAPPPGWVVSEISNDGSYDDANGKVKWGPFFAPFPSEVSYVVIPSDNEDGVRCFAGTISVDGTNQAICGDECVGRACCARMSADLPQPACELCGTGGCGDCDSASCGDGVIGLCELIGYACRWMRGCNDDIAGMTRAAFIWRNGECYCFSDANQNWFVTDCSPNDAGCCTSSTAPSGLSARVNESTGATAKVRPLRKLRSLKSDNLTIPIVVEAPVSATAMALEFFVPKGWDVVSISDGGRWDQANRKAKWGPVFDRLSRTLTVELRRGGGVADNGTRRLSVGRSARVFWGIVSFDGVNSRVNIE